MRCVQLRENAQWLEAHSQVKECQGIAPGGWENESVLKTPEAKSRLGNRQSLGPVLDF